MPVDWNGLAARLTGSIDMMALSVWRARVWVPAPPVASRREEPASAQAERSKAARINALANGECFIRPPAQVTAAVSGVSVTIKPGQGPLDSVVGTTPTQPSPARGRGP